MPQIEIECSPSSVNKVKTFLLSLGKIVVLYGGTGKMSVDVEIDEMIKFEERLKKHFDNAGIKAETNILV